MPGYWKLYLSWLLHGDEELCVSYLKVAKSTQIDLDLIHTQHKNKIWPLQQTNLNILLTVRGNLLTGKRKLGEGKQAC